MKHENFYKQKSKHLVKILRLQFQGLHNTAWIHRLICDRISGKKEKDFSDFPILKIKQNINQLTIDYDLFE